MPRFQVTTRELVYVERTYELTAETPADALKAVEDANGGSTAEIDLVDEQIQDTYGFCAAFRVCDENGEEV